MKSSKGFTITEALVALAILMIITTAILPLSSFVSHERKALSQKRIITFKLHDELNYALQNGSIPTESNETIELVQVTFHFQKTNQHLIEACATWENIMKRKEKVCLYGLPKK